MRLTKTIILLLFLTLASCSVEVAPINIPDHGKNGLLVDTYPLTENMRSEIEGVYKVIEGKNDFGEEVVLKFNNGEQLSIFTGMNTSFCIFNGGYLDSTIIFEGFWRFANGSETGLISMYIQKNNGGKELVSGKKNFKLTLRGIYGRNTENPDEKITLDFDRKIKKSSDDFLIIAHRGGGRNIDRLGASENSIEMIKLAERFGANGIEIDIQLSHDSIPILFHDKKFSKRLIQEDYMIGQVSDYTFPQIRTFCTLINGEKIPTLEEALETVIYHTNLRFVWLDIKEKEVIDAVAQIQSEYKALAESEGRQLEIVLGLPISSVVDEYGKLPNKEDHPALCELSTKNTLEIGAKYWAPRWSSGFSESDIQNLNNSDVKTLIWTLDDPDFIKLYLNDFDLDGILTNYTTVLSYEYYVQKN